MAGATPQELRGLPTGYSSGQLPGSGFVEARDQDFSGDDQGGGGRGDGDEAMSRQPGHPPAISARRTRCLPDRSGRASPARDRSSCTARWRQPLHPVQRGEPLGGEAEQVHQSAAVGVTVRVDGRTRVAHPTSAPARRAAVPHRFTRRLPVPPALRTRAASMPVRGAAAPGSRWRWHWETLRQAFRQDAARADRFSGPA